MDGDKNTRRNPGGRPRSKEPGTPLSTWLRESDYDRVAREASRRGISVSEYARLKLTGQRLPD